MDMHKGGNRLFRLELPESIEAHQECLTSPRQHMSIEKVNKDCMHHRNQYSAHGDCKNKISGLYDAARTSFSHFPHWM